MSTSIWTLTLFPANGGKAIVRDFIGGDARRRAIEAREALETLAKTIPNPASRPTFELKRKQ